MRNIEYMSDGYIYVTADGDYYGLTDAGSRVWGIEDIPEDYDQIAWQVLEDPRMSREVEDDPY